MRHLRRAAFAIALCLTATLPATAWAATQLGPDLTSPPASGFVAVGCQASFPSCSYVNMRSSNPAVTVAAPSPGVITSWSFRAGMSPQTTAQSLTLRTYRQGTQDGLGGYVYAVPVRDGPSFQIPAGSQLPSDPATVLPARTPIATGERVGISAGSPISFAVYNPTSTVTSTVLFPGTTYNGEDYGNALSNTAIAIRATVEPDADGDGYGDETQDCFPADPGRHDCAQPPGPTPVPTPPVVIDGGKCTSGCGGGIVFAPPPPPPPGGDGSKFYVALKCPAGATAPCGGFLIVETESGGGKPRGGGPARVPPGAILFKQLAKKRYEVAPGESEKVKLKLSKAGRKLLARKGKLKVSVTIDANDGGSVSTRRTLRAR